MKEGEKLQHGIRKPEQEGGSYAEDKSAADTKERRNMRTAAVIYTETVIHGEEYRKGYEYAQMRRRQQEREKCRRQRERERRKNYFIQQRIYGIALLILTIAVCAFMRDATIAVITVPLGLTLIVSKRMWLINEYYWSTKERKTLRR